MPNESPLGACNRFADPIVAPSYLQQFGKPDDKSEGPIMPPGAIILWWGDVASIPRGWVLCDGNNNTPNLEGSFVVGAGRSEPPKISGPATAHAHTVSINQTFSTAGAGNHSHKMPAAWYARGLDDGQYAGIDTGNARPQDVTTQESGNHSHQVAIQVDLNSGNAVAPRPKWYALCYIMKL